MNSRGQNDTASYDWDDVFKALAAEPRRRLIVTLNDTPSDQPVPLPEAALAPGNANAQRMQKHLVHRHLPLLEDYAYVSWQKDPFVAERGPRFEHVSIVLETLLDRADRIPDPLVGVCDRLEHERTAEGDV